MTSAPRLLAATLCSTLALGASVVRAEVDLGAIDTFVNEERVAQRIPGLALGIVQRDRVVHVAGFGSADDAGRSVDGDTPFFLGSTTKSFTALAIMQLVEAGRVRLDAPAREYIPWFRVADERASAAITVRELLNQTSGLSSRTGRLTLTDFASDDDAIENRVRLLARVALTAPVGDRFQYSNANYQVLGAIVQHVAGEPYEAYVAKHIFAPLAMTHSFTAKAPAVAAGLALGHRAMFDRPIAFDEPYARGGLPQGFVVSSASDMTHYLIAQLNGGRYDDTSVLSSDGVAQMHRGVAGDADEGRYAMGWIEGTRFDRMAVWHGGDTFSYQTFMVLLPAEGWGVVLLANVNNVPAALRFESIAWGVLGRLLDVPAPREHVHDSLVVHGVVMGIVLLQLLGLMRTATLLPRWRRAPQVRPSPQMKAVRIGAPFLVNAAWSLLVLAGIPRAFGPLHALVTAVPDLGWVLVASASFAGVWAIVRAMLAFSALRSPVPAVAL